MDLRHRCLVWPPGCFGVFLSSPANFGLRNLLRNGMLIR